MSDQTRRFQCRHIFTGGHRCGSACLSHEEFCYYHHTTRRPVENPRRRRSRQSQFDLPLPEDRTAIQSSIGEVLRRIASNEIDCKRAGLLLYGLQIASINLPRATQSRAGSSSTSRSRHTGRLLDYVEPTPEPGIIEEIVIDPKLGTLAPRAEIVEAEEKLSVVGQLLRRFELERQQEEREKAEAAAATTRAAEAATKAAETAASVESEAAASVESEAAASVESEAAASVESQAEPEALAAPPAPEPAAPQLAPSVPEGPATEHVAEAPHQADEIIPTLQATEDANAAAVDLSGRPVGQTLCLPRRRQAQSSRNHRRQQKSNRSDTQRITEPSAFRNMANEKWCGSAHHAADVVDEAHGGGAQRSRKEFAGDDGKSAEVPGPEKPNQRPNDKQRVRIAHKRKQRHQHSSNQKITNVGVLPAKAVREISKDNVPQKCAHLHHDGPHRGVHDAETAAAFC
jgi:hypothetical protein